jgi:hypothetical protein
MSFPSPIGTHARRDQPFVISGLIPLEKEVELFANEQMKSGLGSI